MASALLVLIAASTLAAASSACLGSTLDGQSSCAQEPYEDTGSSFEAALLQRRSVMQPGAALPPPTGWQVSHTADDNVKLFAGVPVYNYDYVRYLERCEEAGSDDCDLDLVQADHGESQGKSGAGPGQQLEEEREGSNARRRRVHEWLVKMRDGVSDQVLHSFCDIMPGKSKCTAQGHPSEGGIPLVIVHGTEEELKEQLHRHQGKSEYVEPDIPMNAIPEVRGEEEETDDQDYYKQNNVSISSFSNSSMNSSEFGEEDLEVQGIHPASWGLDRIDDRYGLDDTYTIGKEGGQNVHIYVADTGIRTTHQDFHGRAVPTLEIRGGIIRECDETSTTCAQDDNGHGTHAAATAGGGRFGVAKSSTLHSVKILSETGRGKMSYLIQALDWVATKGLRPAIFTASVGGEGNPPSVVRAIEAASAAGVTVVVAAGNFGRDACSFSPAHVKSAITVGATENSEDVMATYSNFGDCVDLFAPGSDIHSAGKLSDTAKATMSGTSMATPHVAGAAALLLGEDHTRTPEEILLLLKARATQSTVKGTPGGSGGMMLYTISLEETDELWWQSVWMPSWWKMFAWRGWANFFRPGPMKELIAEGFICCLFLAALNFMLTRCMRFLSLPPGHEHT